jgi:hypothetical protein
MEYPTAVDDDGLAGHGFAVAHRDRHLGAVVLVGGFLQEGLGAERSSRSGQDGLTASFDALATLACSG